MEYNIEITSDFKLNITIMNVNLDFLLKPYSTETESSLVNVMFIPNDISNKLIDILRPVYTNIESITVSEISLAKFNIMTDVINDMNFLILVEEDMLMEPNFIIEDVVSSSHYLKASIYNASYFTDSIVNGTLTCNIQFTDIILEKQENTNSNEIVVSWANNKIIDISNAKISKVSLISKTKVKITH